MTDIERALIDCGIPVIGKGMTYLSELLEITVSQGIRFGDLTKLYQVVADKHGVGRKSIGVTVARALKKASENPDMPRIPPRYRDLFTRRQPISPAKFIMEMSMILRDNSSQPIYKKGDNIMDAAAILDKMKTAHSWRELGVTIADAYKILSAALAAPAPEEIAELQAKVDQLTETNKRLRAENKTLKAGT